MFAVLLIVIAAFSACIIFDKKIHETLPVVVFTISLSVYVFALFLPLPAAVMITSVLTLISPALFFFARHKIDLRALVLTVPVFVFIITALAFVLLLSDRHVFFYDDLSYWALYTKNIFVIDALPHLFENCSVSYKDYTPIIQILQYIAMFGKKAFSEDTMFRANACLIYVLLLPMLGSVFDGKGDTAKSPLAVKITAVILYVIFPSVLTAQFYYRLGVDLFVALTFGYVLYCIYMADEFTVFPMICMISALSFLVLIKTSGIVLCIFALIIFAVKLIASKSSGWTHILRFLILSVFTFGSYFSWQLFLRYTWNNGYLSDRVKSGIKGGGFALPAYTGEVIRNYIVHFFTYPLTRAAFGITAAALVILVVAIFLITKKDRVSSAFFAASLTGFVLFCIAHASMYLFVFDEWEAHGLLEFDRYITQYLGGLAAVYMCILIKSACTGEKQKKSTVVLYVCALAFIILLPYADIRQYLLPSGYDRMYEQQYKAMAENAADEWERSGITDLDLAHDGSARLTMIADVWDETTQFLEYDAVPQPIDRVLNVPAVEEGMIANLADDYMEQYLYVAENAPGAYAGNWEETSVLTADGTPLAPGTLYRVQTSDEGRILEVYEH
ncbi:MAG: hypothetical protein K6E49_08490 [Lachnospiraceae bacterium]|nr:hypothetical protein [Lachnospiraceae bacterium]